jgi:hypothetical protein
MNHGDDSMAEVEIPHAHEVDELGKRVGGLVAVIGILLSVVTIASHREHTAAVVLKTEANDQWAYSQAKKIREYESQVGLTLLKALGTDAAKIQSGASELQAAHDKYAKEAAALQQTAEEKESQTRQAEREALRFDLGEGFLELGLVLSSLYFLTRRTVLPMVGIAAAIIGAALAASGLLL